MIEFSEIQTASLDRLRNVLVAHHREAAYRNWTDAAMAVAIWLHSRRPLQFVCVESGDIVCPASVREIREAIENTAETVRVSHGGRVRVCRISHAK